MGIMNGVVDPFNLIPSTAAEGWETLADQITEVKLDISDMKDRHKQELEPLNRRLDELSKALQSECPHPKDKVERKTSYTPGSYLDRSQTLTWYRCTVCGSESEKQTSYGGYE